MPAVNPLLSCVAALSLAIAATAPAAAQAVTTRQNAAGMCQGALPQFAGTLRARPTGIANEGDADAFVTCSLVGENAQRYQFLNPVFFNRGTASATVSCTIVSGSIQASPWYYTRTVGMAAGTGGTIELVPNGADPANMFNMNCRLPPRTELNYVRIDPQAS